MSAMRVLAWLALSPTLAHGWILTPPSTGRPTSTVASARASHRSPWAGSRYAWCGQTNVYVVCVYTSSARTLRLRCLFKLQASFVGRCSTCVDLLLLLLCRSLPKRYAVRLLQPPSGSVSRAHPYFGTAVLFVEVCRDHHHRRDLPRGQLPWVDFSACCMLHLRPALILSYEVGVLPYYDRGHVVHQKSDHYFHILSYRILV